MPSAAMMHVRGRDTLVGGVLRLWETKCHLDGVMVCRGGQVPFSRLVLAAHSQHLRDLLICHEEDILKIIITDFR